MLAYYCQPQPGDYMYSGIHDHGPLVPPREGGDMAQLIGCVQAAKQFNDEFLTKHIEEEKTKKKKAAAVDQNNNNDDDDDNKTEGKQ